MPVFAPVVAPAILAPVGAPVVPPAVPAPVMHAPNPPVFAGGPDHNVPSTRRRATRKAYARIDTQVLMPIPQLPFANDYNLSDLVQFASLRGAVASLRVACDDLHPYLWTRGWEKRLEWHVLSAVRSTAPQVSTLKSIMTEAIAQGGHLQDEGRRGPDVLQHVIRFLCRGLSRATPAAVMQVLQNMVVPPGTPFSGFICRK